MDPLSLAASVAGLLSITVQVSGAIITYVKAVKDAPKSVQEISQELALTQVVLEKLDKFLRSQSLKHASFDPLSVLPTAIASCNSTVRDVLDNLQNAKQNGVLRMLEKLSWPFTEKQTQKKLDALRRCTSTFQFSLTVEGCNLLSQTSENVTKALELQLYTSKKVLELTAGIGTMSALASEALTYTTQVAKILQLISDFHHTTGAMKSLSDNVEILATRSQEIKEQQILDWLSSNDYCRRHRDIRARRLSGTGEWLLGSEEFQAWLDAANPVLLCTGDPGVGKSFLASLVIDHIHANRPPYTQGLAYYYFEFAQQDSQTPTNLVGSLLRQLASQTASFSQSLLHFYQRFREDDAHGSTVELLLILKEVCRSFEKCFVVIDALDECQKGYRRDFLHIVNVLNMETVQLFVTTRPHSHDIRQHFKDIVNIEVAASEFDIRSYCLQMIESNDVTHELMDDTLKVEVTDSISKNAQGMFLLPVLQMQYILEAMTRAEIRKSINHLSANLGQAFEDTIRRIDNEAQNRREVAKKTLMWILHSCRPLQVNELRYALATQIEEKEFDLDNILPARFIVDCCLGLVVIDNGSSVVRFVHHTLQDYLNIERQGVFQNEETEITKTCLTYLCLNNVPAPEMDQGGFLEYAAAHWGHHAYNAVADEIDDLALSYLTDHVKLARAEKHLLQFPPQRSELAWHREIRVSRVASREGVSGLHVAAAFGLARITRLLLNAGSDCNTQDSRCNTPLHEAACNGQIEAASVLLAHGADPNLANHDKNTALFLAVSFAYKDVALLLLRHGADPDVRCVDGWRALHEAADKGHLEVLDILLEHKASIQLQSARGLSALHRAAGRGHLEIIKLLFDCGSPIDTTTTDGWTPLHGASSSGQFDAVRLLLENNAYIDHQTLDGRTSLHRASRGGHHLTVATLLSKGANHLITDHDENLPLHRAAKGGHSRIVKLLLDHDPSARTRQLTAQNKLGRVPRAEASYCGHWKAASILREEEVSHHRSNSDTRDALDIAVEEGNLKLVDELLTSGVDMNKLNLDGVTPIHQAFLMGNEPLAELLIQKNANLKVRTSDGWEPLHCAAKTGIESAVRRCLNCGADILAATDDGQTALHKVCKSGVLPTTKLLVERGADLEAQDNWGWRPLHTASAAGFKDIVEFLISAGADREVRDKEGRSLQHCAAGAGHHALVEYLRMERHRNESNRAQKSFKH